MRDTILDDLPPESPSFADAISPFWHLIASSDWAEADIPRRQWLVPSYLMRGKVSALIGAPEAGKSTLALKWGIALVLDAPFGGYKPCPLPGEAPRARRVMILNAEDDEDEQRRRISALIREVSSRTIADLGNNLIRVNPKGETARLFQPGLSAGEVVTTQALEDLKTQITAMHVDVLVLDPLVELMGGADENSNAVMGMVFATLRALAKDTGIAILVIHHVRKGQLVPGSLEAARGGGALGGSIRCAHTLAVMSEAEAEALGVPKDIRRNYVRLDGAKQSYAPPAEGADWFHRFSVPLSNGETAAGLEAWQPAEALAVSLNELAPVEAAIKAGATAGEPYSAKLASDARSVKHALRRCGIEGKVQADRIMAALREHCGMVDAPYVRRNSKGQRCGTALGLRIGNLPAVEWAAAAASTVPVASGSGS